jgi:hypothetical protein
MADERFFFHHAPLIIQVMSEEKDLRQILKDFDPQRTEPQGFKLEQMLKCESCERTNPPTRSSCLYCGTALPVVETALTTLQKPKLKKLESWEQGFNAVLLSQRKRELADNEISEVANFLDLSTNDFKRIIETNIPLPLVHTSSYNEASLIENGLKHFGLEVGVVSDRDMFIEDMPGRLRGLTFTDSMLTGRDLISENAMNLSWEDARLIVVGRVFERRIETEEKVSRKEVKELADSREYSTDQMQLDIYGGDYPLGWRVVSDKFDFSCLGQGRSLIASQNFESLIGILRVRATEAVFDNSYNRVQSLLNLVWPAERRTESLGLKRRNFGQMISRHAITSSNETQFLRYSRLRSFLNAHEK